MNTDALNVRFRGQEYLLVGDLGDGALTTPEDYANWNGSFAHVLDGEIWQHRAVIGKAEEIEVLGPAELPEPTDEGLERLMAFLLFGEPDTEKAA